MCLHRCATIVTLTTEAKSGVCVLNMTRSLP